jgi:hypothetical protein
MRQANRPTQLDWSALDEMRWEALPPDVRDQLREQLGRLLRRVAACSPEAADDT